MPSIDKCNICLGPLGFCPKPKLILHTRSHALSPYVLAINETDRVLEPLVKLAAGKTALWEWFKSNINEIKEKVGGVLGRFALIVQLCTANLSTREQFEDVESFFEDKDTDVSIDPMNDGVTP